MAAPSASWVKIITDGASKGNPGMAAAGEILRNNSSNLVGAFVELLGNQTSVFSEAKSILLGLRFAKNLGHQLVWVETDSLFLVNILNGTEDVPFSISYIVREVKNLLKNLVNASSHIYLENVMV